MTEVEQAIRSWLRLDAAFAAFNAELVRRHGVTGAQLGMLRLVAEFGGRIALAEMRERLALHPATLGQLLARLAEKDLVVMVSDEHDRRRRIVELTDAGRGVIASAPLAGPVRLRSAGVDTATLTQIAEGMHAALHAFGLADYANPRKTR
jgi:DNA-binding MarR family transcriptional regulator